MNADLLLSGGHVFRGWGRGFTEALAVRAGRIMAVGAEALDAAGPGTRWLDLGGRLAVPAFTEAHMHLLPFGLGLAQLDLRPPAVATLDALLARLAAAARDKPKGSWIIGRGYDHAELDIGRHPLATELDAAAPDHPVVIFRCCGHMLVANSLAMRLAGVEATTPDPVGGAIGREKGKLTGLFQERAMALIRAAIPPPSAAAMAEALAAGCRALAALGFTAATDMNVGMIAGLAEIDAYEAARREGRLPLRLWLVLAGNPEEGIIEQAMARGLRPMAGDKELRWAGVKVFADGSAGGLTAAFFDPYSPAAGGGTGILTFADETMQALIRRYHEQGWQLAIHAIGDRAIEQVLQAMEAADSARYPLRGRRHRIEHCGFVTADQRRRMRAHGILPVPQPIFLYEFGDLYLANLGPARAAAAYPMRSWLEEEHHPSASSDAPVAPLDPLLGIAAMMTRQSKRGTLLGPQERLRAEEALHCYSWCGAYSQFAEMERGSLEPGMAADIAVLSADICALPPAAVATTKVDLTLREGVPIFDRHDELTQGGGL